MTADLIEADTASPSSTPSLSGDPHPGGRLRDSSASPRAAATSATEQHNRADEQEIGLIQTDAITPRSVRYNVEETRVGQRTNYDRLILEIWTNGTLTPDMALVEAAKILRKHLNPFVQYFELGQDRVSEAAAAAAGVDEDLIRKLNMPISELDLSVRASNCLESARVDTVAHLVSQSEAELLKLRSFGRTSLREVKRKLQDIGLDLGMTLPEGYQAPVRAAT